ncbi:MAG: transporter substrate-binding domain-containing protein [Lachnospiraceae bacterium]|nr:transporter substrate-binding domain-containing protein [Lachnospiraceae bacterium]
MKKLLAVLMSLTLTAALFTGCGSSSGSSDSGKSDSSSVSEDTSADDGTPAADTDTSADGGTLRVGMEIGYPPLEYYDDDGVTPIGIDVELSNALSKEMGMEVELIDTAWAGIFAGLDKGDYDCIISAVSITSDRLLEFEFSNPYIKNYQCIVTKADASTKPASLDELKDLNVGYQEETTSDDYLNNYMAVNSLSVNTNAYAKVINVFDDLELGRLDAVVCDSIVAESYVADGKFEITWQQGEDEETEEFGICMKKGNTELKDKVNAALATLDENGTLDEIIHKYLPNMK